MPVPNDWDDHICVSGYWFLETPSSEWEPPEDLVAFMKKARDDGKKIAYCGFGSITVSDPQELTRSLYDAVKEADVRAIVAKGWSGRMSEGKEDDGPEPEVPEEVYQVESIPHDWLFKQIDIALHHGGAGTTGASLRAGLVTLIKPFFGDQFFWANRTAKLGAGLRVSSLSVSDISGALKKAANDRIMAEKAAQVGERIRAEDGVHNAIAFMNSNLGRARRVPDFRGPTHHKPHRTASSESNHKPTPKRTSTAETSSSIVSPTSETSASATSSEEAHSDNTTPDEESSLRRTVKKLLPGASSDSAGDKDKGASTPGEEPRKSSEGGEEDHGLLSKLPSISLPSLPKGTLPSLPKSETLSSLSLPGAFKQMLDSDNKYDAPGRINTDDLAGSATNPDDSPSRRTYQTAKAEDKRRAALLAPKLEKLELARQAATNVEHSYGNSSAETDRCLFAA